MEFAQYEVKDRIGYITLNRPDKRNALNFAVVQALKEAFARAETDENCKVVVLRAAGEVFCAGADLKYLQEIAQNSYEENVADSTHLMELFLKIYTLKKVVIGQIHGHAIAGGCGLAAICDISFTVPEAKFGYTEVKIGFIPAIVSVFLLRKIGEGRTKQLLISGDLISAETALELGLVNFVIEKDALEKTVYEYAQKLCYENSGQSMMLTKQMLGKVPEMTLNESLTYATKQNALARNTTDCQRGIAAFLNKEKIIW